MTDRLEDEEELCLDALAWADELARWAEARPSEAEACDAPAITAMLRALVKSIRLSIFVDGSSVDRGYLIEELQTTIAASRRVATGRGPKRVDDALEGPAPPALDPAAAHPTTPPPAGESAEEVWANAPMTARPDVKRRSST